MRNLKEEENYKKKLQKYWESYNYILQPNEEIVQCLSEEEDGRYYNPKWFVSSEGYLMSVASSTLKILKPSIKFGGKKSGCESKITDYVKNYGQKISAGQTPQYYFYVNTYGGKRKEVRMHRLIAHYFAEDFRDNKTEVWEAHHIKAMDWNKSPQENNCAKNLQAVKPKQHKGVTRASMITEEKLSQRIEEAETGFYKKQTITAQAVENNFSILFSMQEPGTEYYIVFCDDEKQVVETKVQKFS